MDIDPWKAAVDHLDQYGIPASDRAIWESDPVRWAVERACVVPWSKQAEIMESVRDHDRVAVHSCHNVGKTYAAALVACWWIDVHPPGTAFVLSTAPTGPQVKALLWREINRLHTRAALPGRTNLTEWYLDNELVAFGRKPSEHSPSAFQGIHSKYVLVILDEACGIPTSLWTAAETIASNDSSRILSIGNPDSLSGEFAAVCQPDSGWEVIHIGYADTPNFTNEPVPTEISNQLISAEWVRKRREAWGENSALFHSKVLGKFPPPDSDPWTIVPYSDAVRCRYLDLPESEPYEAGIDVGAGSDRTVIRERRGPRAGRVESFRDPESESTIGRMATTLADWGTERVKIDVVGIGWGVYGALRSLSAVHNPGGDRVHSATVVPVNFGASSSDHRRFANKRAEVWWRVGRENTRSGSWDLSEIDDDTLAELCSAQYQILDRQGRVQVEAKTDIVKRLRRSPDQADALLLAFYTGDNAGPAATGADTFSRGFRAASGRSPFDGAARSRASSTR